MDYIKVADIGSYYIGGKKVTISGGKPFYAKLVDGWKEPMKYSPDGEYQTGQMYVQYTRLADPKCPYPVCLIHGGGLCGAMWERTLDNRPGWAFRFLQNGYHINISDGCDRGRSSWSRYPEINTQPPFFRTYEEAWATFRLGKEYPTHYEGIRFDLGQFDNFMKQQVPRFPASASVADAAYESYFAKMSREGGYILLAYSEGGLFALRAALKHPENIKAIILVESTSTLDVDTTDVSLLKNIPILHIWGDYVSGDFPWAANYAFEDTMRRFHEKIIEMGGDSTWLHLPSIGIKNNTHALIVEDNSDEIFNIVLQWLRAHRL